MLILANCKATLGNYGENYTKEFFFSTRFSGIFKTSITIHKIMEKIMMREKIGEVKEEEYKIEIVLS